MKQTFDLSQMGFNPLNNDELILVNAGKFLDWVVRIGCGIAIVAGIVGSAGIALAGLAIAGAGMFYAL